MKKYLIVTADTNDADYITENTEISDKDLEILKPLFKSIKNFKPYKVKYKSSCSGEIREWTHDNNFPWGNGEYMPREDLGEKSVEEIYSDHKEAVELFTEGGYCPYGEYGIHTIESIEVMEVASKKKLL